MFSRTAALFGSVLLLAAALWLACSDKSATSLGSSPVAVTSGVGQYFPLSEGYSTTYTVRYADGRQETTRFKVGHEVSFGGGEAYEWYSYTESGAVDISYFKVTEEAVDHYGGQTQTAQRILELPLKLGHSWTVNGGSGDSYFGDYDSLSAGSDDDKLPFDTVDVYDDNGPLFSYPALGPSYFTVEGWENLKMDNGVYHSSALKVSSSDRYGVKSYFWYAAGVGLVRYVIEATGADFPEGRVVGELVYYGYN